MSHDPLQSSRGRALSLAVCFKGGCLRVLQLSALGRRQEALCVQVQAGGPVSACFLEPGTVLLPLWVALRTTGMVFIACLFHSLLKFPVSDAPACSAWMPAVVRTDSAVEQTVKHLSN